MAMRCDEIRAESNLTLVFVELLTTCVADAAEIPHERRQSSIGIVVPQEQTVLGS